MKINLHLGAHKTATTYIQSRLAANRAALNAAGIGFCPLLELRRSFTRHLLTLSPKSFRIESMADSFFASGKPDSIRGLIISDENLLGGFLKSGELYGGAPDRLRRLRALLAGHEVTLFFAIRSYDSSIASAYCESLRHTTTFEPFESLKRQIDIERFRWPLAFARIMDALQPQAAVAWRYEDFRGNDDSVLRKLAFDAAGTLGRPGRNARPSFSGTAIDILKIIAEKHGNEIAGRLMPAIGRRLRKARDNDGFDPWSELERVRLRQLYEADCERFPTPLLTIEAPKPLQAHERRLAGGR